MATLQDILSGNFPAAQRYAEGYAQMPSYLQDPYLGLSTSQVGNVTKGLLSKTQFEKAQEIASKNAETLLGLPKGNTAMDRAKAMGYNVDEPMYHGSPYSSITAFKPNARGANFFTQDKDLAEQFTRYGPIHEEGATTYPTLVRPGKTFDPKTSQGKNELEYYIREKGGYEFRNRPQLEKSTPNEIANYIANDSDNWHFLESEQFQRFLKNRDYNSFKVTEQGVENIAIYNPKNVRSQFAAFDPARANEPDLLAATMAFPISGLLQEPKEKKKKK